jgi:hypothetical protein
MVFRGLIHKYYIFGGCKAQHIGDCELPKSMPYFERREMLWRGGRMKGRASVGIDH